MNAMYVCRIEMNCNPISVNETFVFAKDEIQDRGKYFTGRQSCPL
jgi:hypothetical protein